MEILTEQQPLVYLPETKVFEWNIGRTLILGDGSLGQVGDHVIVKMMGRAKFVLFKSFPVHASGEYFSKEEWKIREMVASLVRVSLGAEPSPDRLSQTPMLFEGAASAAGFINVFRKEGMLPRGKNIIEVPFSAFERLYAKNSIC